MCVWGGGGGLVGWGGVGAAEGGSVFFFSLHVSHVFPPIFTSSFLLPLSAPLLVLFPPFLLLLLFLFLLH